jgi:hydrogenase-4 component B
LRCFVVLLDGSPGSAIGVLGFFNNVLLASLTLVFTASNAFFFLVAWEVMALSAYCLVSFEHEKEETRKAGILFLVMSRAGTGLLPIAFLVLATFKETSGAGCRFASTK